MHPAVSLALPVFNGERYLEAALGSLLGQTFADFEIVIADNASTDATPEICRRFAEQDPRVRYYRQQENIGAGPNFNHAFGLARAEFFKWCAHDDLISPNFIEACVSTLRSQPRATLAFGETICIDEVGKAIPWHKDPMPSLEDENAAKRFGRALRESASCWPIFGLFRTEALRRSTLFRPYYGSDRVLIAEAALLGKAVLVKDAIFYSRDHRGRSVKMMERRERRLWHSGSTRRWESMENINLLSHTVEIAFLHRDVASPGPVLLEIGKTSLRPKQFARYWLDLMLFVSPSAGEALLRGWRRVARPILQPQNVRRGLRTANCEEG